jgi:hypothetical protein
VAQTAHFIGQMRAITSEPAQSPNATKAWSLLTYHRSDTAGFDYLTSNYSPQRPSGQHLLMASSKLPQGDLSLRASIIAGSADPPLVVSI